MSYIVATRDIAIKDRALYRQQSVEYITRGCLEQGIARDIWKLKVRDLLPIDLGLLSWEVPKHQRFVRFVQHTVRENTVLCIYKVLQIGADPTARLITFRLGRNITLGKHNLDIIYSELPIMKQLKDVIKSQESLIEIIKNNALKHYLLSNPMEGYFTEPFIYIQGSDVVIDLELSHSGDNYIVLGGFVAEPWERSN